MLLLLLCLVVGVLVLGALAREGKGWVSDHHDESMLMAFARQGTWWLSTGGTKGDDVVELPQGGVLAATDNAWVV